MQRSLAALFAVREARRARESRSVSPLEIVVQGAA